LEEIGPAADNTVTFFLFGFFFEKSYKIPTFVLEEEEEKRSHNECVWIDIIGYSSASNHEDDDPDKNTAYFDTVVDVYYRYGIFEQCW